MRLKKGQLNSRPINSNRIAIQISHMEFAAGRANISSEQSAGDALVDSKPPMSGI
jgi:hypothetical protein